MLLPELHADCIANGEAALSSSTLVRRCGISTANCQDPAQWPSAMTMHVYALHWS